MTVFGPERLREIAARERARFHAERPKSMALLERAKASMPAGVPMAWMGYFYPAGPFVAERAEGAYLHDIDGHSYLDMNLADTSMATGYAVPEIAAAVEKQFRLGSQFLVPTEDALWVSEEMARRFGLPYWQFTLSASSANSEAMRIARAKTGRDKILMFDGKYHGMLEESLQYLEDGEVKAESRGLPSWSGQGTVLVDYNDLEAVERVLRGGEIAGIIVEPAITNVGGVLLPAEDFHAGLRELATRFGAVLIFDEAHTHVCAYGGLTRQWKLDPDILVLGKALAGGIPVGAYGLRPEMAAVLEERAGDSFEAWRERVAVGGTLFGNALQIAATKTTLEKILTPENHARVNGLGEDLAQGIEAIIERLDLPWCAYRLFCRSGYHPAPELPRSNADMAAAQDSLLHEAIHLYLSNRGIWEAIDSASPAVSFAATGEDVAFYLRRLEECLTELRG